ncbi:MAG: OmpA family protein [Saprospiraceae bacterium]
MKLFSLLLFTFLSLPIFLFSQEKLNPTFDIFKGTAYEIPYKERYNLKYHPKYEKYPIITEFEWDEIDIPETEDVNLFPSVNKRYGFALILTSTVKISSEGWYKFSLNSDDGSLLWIEKKLLVNNDGTHQMLLKEDSIALVPGNYPIKIWYYQGFPDRYGFQFNASFYRKLNANESITPLKKKSKKEENIKLVISNQVLNFEHNSYQIDGKAKLFLDDFCKKTLNKVDLEKIELIKITGHTDNSGSANYNAQLSLQRAESLANELKKRILSDEIKYELKGLGESLPIASNNTPKGKLKNRRVVLEIIFKEN